MVFMFIVPVAFADDSSVDSETLVRMFSRELSFVKSFSLETKSQYVNPGEKKLGTGKDSEGRVILNLTEKWAQTPDSPSKETKK